MSYNTLLNSRERRPSIGTNHPQNVKLPWSVIIILKMQMYTFFHVFLQIKFCLQFSADELKHTLEQMHYLTNNSHYVRVIEVIDFNICKASIHYLNSCYACHCCVTRNNCVTLSVHLSKYGILYTELLLSREAWRHSWPTGVFLLHSIECEVTANHFLEIKKKIN